MNEVLAIPTSLEDMPPSTVRKYPWNTMDVGNSFPWPGTKHSAYTSTRRAGRRYGRKFVVRSKDGKISVWRME